MPDSRSDAPASGGLMQVGLLLETVQQQQHQVQGLLQRLESWSDELDEVVRDALRQTLLAELQAAGQAARQAGDALQAVRRQAVVRAGIWSLCLVTACTAVPAALAWALMPDRAQVASLHGQLQDMTARMEQLKRQGGRIDLRRCGPAPRLCVRVDRKAPVYGDGDYFVVKGY